MTIILVSCDIFSTRQPEEPDTGLTAFQQPISPLAVLSNLELSIISKNIENYLLCLGAGDNDSEFRFQASAGAMAAYPGIFSFWDIDSERRYFQSLVANTIGDSPISYRALSNANPQFFPDSAIFLQDYNFELQKQSQSEIVTYTGRMQLTIKRRENGTWFISNWIDTPINSSNEESTWSILKAEFYN